MTNPIPIHIRPARESDAPGVTALLDAASLEATYVAQEFVVAHDADGAIVGCARLKPLGDGASEIASVAVAPTLRGRGVGERLVRTLLDRATGPVHGLMLAPGFFERLGFAHVDEVPAALRAKAETTCASTGFVPMTWQRA